MELIKSGTNFDFLSKSKLALTVSAVVILAIWILVPFTLRMGVDFAGGTEIEVKFNQPVSPADVRHKVEGAGFEDASVQQYGDKSENSFLVRVERISIVSPEQAQALRQTLQTDLAAYGVQSIDFDPNAGNTIGVRTEKPVPLDTLRASVEKSGIQLSKSAEAVRDLTRAGQPSYQVLTMSLSDKVTASLEQAFGADKVEVRRVEYVGPQVGAQLRNRGIMAVLLSMGAILLYVAFRFQPKFAPGVIVALIHDVTVVTGFYVVSGHEFNLTSIAVLLTVVGYSMNDTIVIFDRVREIEARKTGKSLYQIINDATNESLGRTIITSFVTALSLLGLLIFGVGTIWDFAAAMLIGIVIGTYSTMYIASPFALWFDKWMAKRETEKKALAASQAKSGSPTKPKRPAHAD